MANVVLTNASVSPWIPPADCPPGVVCQIEATGAGSGASGGSTSFRSGGAGAAWAQTFYQIVSSDVTNGIAFSISTGSAGTAGANPTAGADTSFGTAPKNLIINNTNYGAVVGGAFPTTWQLVTPNNLTVSVAGMGIDSGTGFPYIDVSYVGTTNVTGQTDLIFTNNNTALQAIPVLPSVSYTSSIYMSATNTTGLTGMASNVNWNTAAGAFISNPNIFTTTLSTSLVRRTGTVTSPATAASAFLIYRISYNTGTAINLTIRFAGVQFEQAASASSVLLTPTSYVLAKGGGAPVGTVGGVAARPEFNVGFKMFVGGGGAARASGGGGGGSGGPAGAGATSTTATGGTGDAGSGGTAGVSNVEGGGGGTASASGAAGGAPGAGAGANTSTGSGGTGGRGQVRITYTPTSYGPRTKPWRQRHMLVR